MRIPWLFTFYRSYYYVVNRVSSDETSAPNELRKLGTKLSGKSTKEARIREVEAFIWKREKKYQRRKGVLDAEQRDLTNAYGTVIIPMRKKRDKLQAKKRNLERDLEEGLNPARKTEFRNNLMEVEKKLNEVQENESKVELKFEKNMNLWKKKQNKLGQDKYETSF